MLGIKPANVAFRTGCTIYLVIYLDAKQHLSYQVAESNDPEVTNFVTEFLCLARRENYRASKNPL